LLRSPRPGLARQTPHDPPSPTSPPFNTTYTVTCSRITLTATAPLDLLKREKLNLDDEKVKEFFPLEGTIERLLGVYSELLGLQVPYEPY
jgi:hypothetical protein